MKHFGAHFSLFLKIFLQRLSEDICVTEEIKSLIEEDQKYEWRRYMYCEICRENFLDKWNSEYYINRESYRGQYISKCMDCLLKC